MAHTPTAQDRTVDDVGDWIDQYTLASLVYDTIKEEFGINPTLGQCQDVWYRVLDQLGDLVEECARCLTVDFDEPARAG